MMHTINPICRVLALPGTMAPWHLNLGKDRWLIGVDVVMSPWGGIIQSNHREDSAPPKQGGWPHHLIGLAWLTLTVTFILLPYSVNSCLTEPVDPLPTPPTNTSSPLDHVQPHSALPAHTPHESFSDTLFIPLSAMPIRQTGDSIQYTSPAFFIFNQ